MARRCKGCPDKLLWFPLMFSSSVWSVVLVMPSQLHSGKTLGLCCFQCRRILISVIQSDEEIADTFWHEAIHAAVGNEKGEKTVSAAEKGICGIAKFLGAKLPAFPKGFHAMRAEAKGEIPKDKTPKKDGKVQAKGKVQ